MCNIVRLYSISFLTQVARMASRRALKAVLIDLSGTLHIEDTAVPGAQDALSRWEVCGSLRLNKDHKSTQNWTCFMFGCCQVTAGICRHQVCYQHNQREREELAGKAATAQLWPQGGGGRLKKLKHDYFYVYNMTPRNRVKSQEF